jgi:prevent-host-death family protein
MHMYNLKNIATVTDLRERTIEVLEEVKKSEEPVVVFKRNKPQAVIINIKKFDEILDRLEDLYDNYLADKVAKEPVKKKIPIEEVAKEWGIKLDK